MKTWLNACNGRAARNTSRLKVRQPLGEDGDSEFGDLIEDSEAVVPADAVSFTLLQEQLHQVLDTLSEREALGFSIDTVSKQPRNSCRTAGNSPP